LQKEVSNYRGGNIKNYFEEWEKISSDKFILDIIKFGLKLEFKNNIIPNQKAFSCLQFNAKEEVAISSELQKLLKKCVIEECDREEGDYVSSIFTRPKKDGSLRTILNLKKFNEFIEYKHFKMESISTALNLINPGDFMG